MAADYGQKKCRNRSGKTIRYIKEQAAHGNMSAFTGQFAIIKEKVGAFDASQSMDFEKVVQDGGLESDTRSGRFGEPVMYSLNKKKRWLLPGMIAEGIADEEFYKDCDYQVVMVEREIPYFKDVRALKIGKASCKAVYRSNSEGISCRRATKNCSYEKDLLKNLETIRNRRKEKAERRRERARTGKRINIPPLVRRAEEDFPRLPQLRYEVLRPTPLHQCTTQSIYKSGVENYDPWSRRKFSGQKKNNPPKSRKVQLDTDLSCEDIHVDFDEDEEWPIQTVPGDGDLKYLGEETASFDLGSFISQWTEFGKRNRQKTFKKVGPKDEEECSNAMPSLMRKRYGKGCAIYRPDLANLESEKAESKSDLSDVDTMDSGFDSDGSSTIQDDHKVSWLHLGSVAKEGVHPDRLRMDFGHDYMEGRCTPRRFSIKMKAVSSSQVPVCASAVFAVEDVHQNPTMVNLSLRCCSADFRVQDLHRAIRERISIPLVGKTSIIEQLKEILSYHVCSQERLGSKISKLKRPEVTLDTVQSMMGWTFNYETAERVKAQLDDEDEAEYDQDSTSSKFCPEGEDSCGICFETLASSGGEDEKGTALHGCGHLFCNACWVHHVTSRVLMGETNIHCPAFRCESVLDKVTLLSLLPDALTHIHLTHLQDNRINGHPEWKWCPNPKCGRLVQVQEKIGSGLESSGQEVSERLLGVPVPCECGMLWCSECLEAAHWPATCKQAEQHLQYVNETGVDSEKSERIRSVEVKRCPSCRNPMEKNGGCMHMMCNCGFSFCWECLAAWGDHDWEAWVFKCPQQRENLETVLLSSKKNQSVSYTELAVENRKMRNHHTITKHHQQALRLARRMFFVPEAAFHLSDDGVLPQGILSLPDPIPWSYSSCLTDQSRLTTLIAKATQMAAFAAEVRLLLEYVSTLIGLLPRKQRKQKNGWKVMILRLMFIALRMEELLKSQHEQPAEDVWRRLTVLLYHGQRCIRDITRTVPLLHKGLQNVKSQGSKKTVGGDTLVSGSQRM